MKRSPSWWCVGGTLVLISLLAACGRSASAPLITTDSEDEDSRMRATLARECVKAGGRQTLTVRTEPGAGVTYDSTYSDGESGRAAPHGKEYGGEGIGLITDEALAATWTVSKKAPPGIVVVYVSALLGDEGEVDPDEAFTRLRLSYLLVGPDQECPDGAPEIPAPEVVTDTGDDHPDLRATLAHECVEAGGRQTLRVRGASGSLTYNTIYANGESGRPRPQGGGYGGSGFGVLGPDTEAELGWDIEKDAPPGLARVLVSFVGGGQTAEDGGAEPVRLELAFRVAGPGEECG